MSPRVSGRFSSRHGSRHLQAMLRRLQATRPREVLLPAALVTSVVVGLVATALAWPFARKLVLLASTSVLLAYLIAPLVEVLRRRLTFGAERRPISRGAALLVIYACFGIAGGLAWRLGEPKFERQAVKLSVRAHRTMHTTIGRLRTIDQAGLGFPRASVVGSGIVSLAVKLADGVEAHSDAVWEEADEHLPFLPWLGLAPVIAFFLIKDFKSFRTSAIRVLPEGHLRWRAEEFFRHVNSVLAGYARAQLLSCLVVGVLCTAGFAVLRIPYPLALGALAGVFEFLPVVGPLAIALLAASLVTGTQLFLLIALLIALRLVQDYLIYPRLTGKRMHLHPLAVVLGVLLGAKLGGLVGVFCAVPLVGVGAVILRHYREFRDIQLLILEHEREMAAAPARATAPASDASAPAATGAVMEEAVGAEGAPPGVETGPDVMASDPARLT